MREAEAGDDPASVRAMGGVTGVTIPVRSVGGSTPAENDRFFFLSHPPSYFSSDYSSMDGLSTRDSVPHPSPPPVDNSPFPSSGARATMPSYSG